MHHIPHEHVSGEGCALRNASELLPCLSAGRSLPRGISSVCRSCAGVACHHHVIIMSSQGLPGRVSKSCQLSGQENWDVVLHSTCNVKCVAKHMLLLLI